MIIQIKHSANTGNAPSSLANGELALNFQDQKLFYQHANGTVILLANGQSLGVATDQFARDDANGAGIVANAAFVQANAAFNKANGAAQNAFNTILIAGQNNVVALSNTSNLTLVNGESILMTTDAPNNKITIAVTVLNGGVF